MGSVGVVGGGTMGAGIAHVFAASGAEIVIVEVDARSAQRTRASIEASLRQGQARGSSSRSSRSGCIGRARHSSISPGRLSSSRATTSTSG
ncbi:MAG TPA: 3-hydroxyacyl-CoA dehydrogenase NAD-binding domain-containing protein [Acidimicrobiia bacterium]